MSRSLSIGIAAAALVFGAAPAAGTAAQRHAAAPASRLPAGDLQYQDLGPGMARLFLSSPYPDGGRVVWACGRSVVAKIDAATFDVLATLRRRGAEPDDSGRRDRQLAAIDATLAERDAAPAAPAGASAPDRSSPTGWPPVSDAPPLPWLDAEGRLLVPEVRAIVAYGDVQQGDRLSGIRVAQRFELPASIPGRFTGLAGLADGHVVAATTAGAVVALARGFSRLATVTLPDAPRGRADSEWVRGPIVADDDGGLFGASARHLHRIAWDGSNLSVAAADGAWREPVEGGFAAGTLPAALDAGADRLVAGLGGASASTLFLMWRGALPPAAPGSSGPPARIAAERSIGAGAQADRGIAARPEAWANAPPRMDVAGASRGSMPTRSSSLLVSNGTGGLEKVTWNPRDRRLTSDWTRADAPAPMGGVALTPDGKRVWYVGRRDGRPVLVGIDWESGAVSSDRGLGGARFLAPGAAPLLDSDGRFVTGTLFGVTRIDLAR